MLMKITKALIYPAACEATLGFCFVTFVTTGSALCLAASLASGVALSRMA